jgi:dienelactone hydrolase
MKSNLIKSCLWLIFVCLNCPAQSGLPKGEIVERVAVGADASQSYALYLPKSYTPERKWPILYAFEPMGRGKLPVGIFQEAAEKYGYIVVGSDNSRNGLDGADLSKILSALWGDTHQRFSIDERRVYTTGFSGGARVAVSLAASCRCVAGVIGNGAGFPSQLKPAADLPFIYFNAIGIDDYNFSEINALQKSLAEVKLTHRIEKFDGAHQWLTEAVAEEALAWMQLHAIKRGILAEDEKFLEEYFQSRVARAAESLAKKQPLESFSAYTAVAADFSGIKDIAQISREIESQRRSDELRKAMREEGRQIAMQAKHAAFILSLGAKLMSAEEKITVLPELRNYLAYLQKDAGEKVDGSERRIARRALGQVFAQAYEAGLFTFERAKKYDLALINYELANEINPQSPRVPYDRARVYALSGQMKKALEFLEKAAGLGFKNWPEMEAEKAFEKLRQEERFRKLLAGMKEK